MLVAMVAEPRVVCAHSFNDAQGVGDVFRSGRSVDLWLDELPEDEARRLIDFASGLCFAGGTMQQVGPWRYQLDPLPPRSPDSGTSNDREPRNPRPYAGSGAEAVPVPILE
jgi:hypothetical protein